MNAKPALEVGDSPIAIDRNIPIPPPRFRSPKYPWPGMKVGDSFFVHGDEKTVRSVRWATKDRATRHGEAYVTRAKSNGVRVWRVK